MPQCPYCNSISPEQYNFCINCEIQIKCLQCGSLLVANKSRCLSCGKRIEEADTGSASINRFTLEEKSTSKSSYRKIEGHLSDNAFGQAASLFGGLPQTRPSSSHQPRIIHEASRLALPNSHPVITETDSSFEESKGGDEAITVTPEMPPSHHTSMPIDRAQRYFDLDSDSELIARMSDFKGVNKQEQQKRFMILYVWAYALILGKPEPSKKIILAALSKKGFSDSNSFKHFSSIENKYFSKAGGGYRINLDGEKEVNRILNEIENDSIRGFQDWDKVKPRERSARLNKDISERIDRWVDMPVDINNFDVRKLKKASNYALFTIWVLTSRLKVEKAVKPVEIFNYLKRKYAHVPVTQKTINAALARPYNASVIEKTSDGGY